MENGLLTLLSLALGLGLLHALDADHMLAVSGLTHKQSYKDIFAITIIKTLAVAVVITTYYLTGIV